MAGLTSVRRLSQTFSSLNGAVSRTLSCPQNTLLLHGGAIINSGASAITGSYPSTNPAAGTWTVTLFASGTSSMTVYVLCAS